MSTGKKPDLQRAPEPGHVEVAYQEITEPGYALVAADTFKGSQTADGLVLLDGRCPRCHADIGTTLPQKMVMRGRGKLGAARPQETGHGGHDTPLMCTCTFDHTGLPPGLTGCGAYWMLHIGVPK